jgi:hypothetical protein
MRERIQEEFESFVGAAFPARISEAQKNDLRRTFFAGANSLFWLITAELSPGFGVTSEDLEMMCELRAELLAFPELVARGER